MNALKRFGLALLLLLVAGQAMAAMTVVREEAGGIERITISWTSDSGGAVTQSDNLSGIIYRVVTDPDATAPTDNYDLTAIDAYGLDVFNTKGVDRDTANTEHFCPVLAVADGAVTSVVSIAHFGDVTMTIANAGNAKVGRIIIFMKRN